MTAASRVFGWQHLARYSRQTDEWLDATLGAIVLAARTPTATGDTQHGYGTEADCICGRNFGTVRGLREHLTKARKATTTNRVAEWDCDNFTEPATCLSAGVTVTARCARCRLRLILAEETVELATPTATGDDLRDRVAAIHQRVPSDSPFNSEGRDVCSVCMDGIHASDWPCATLAVLAASPAPVVSRPETTVKAGCGCTVGGIHRYACAGVGNVDPSPRAASLATDPEAGAS